VWIRLCEAKDSVLEGSFSCGNGCPQHGGEVREQGGQVSHDPFVDEALQVWHLTRVQKRVDDLPVRPVPAYKEDSLR